MTAPTPEKIQGCYGALTALYVMVTVAGIAVSILTGERLYLIPTGLFTVVVGRALDRGSN